MKKSKRPELIKTIREEVGLEKPDGHKSENYFSRNELIEIVAHLNTLKTKLEANNVQDARTSEERDSE